MKKYLVMLMVAAVLGLVVPASAQQYYLAGVFNGWTSDGTLMIEISPGIWSATISGFAPGSRSEFKVTDGTWDWSYPGQNSWFYADASGVVTVTFNTNTVSDGWLPAQNRLTLSADPGNWTVAGGFQGWDNANPATTMTSLGRGVHMYMLSASLTPGFYEFKPVLTGTWDSLTVVERSVGTPNMSVTLTEGFDVVNLYVDALKGAVRMGSELGRIEWPYGPEPTSGEADLPVDGLTLSWSVAQVPTLADPNLFDVDPNLVSHNVYLSDGSWDGEPNLVYAGSVMGWDTETLRASYIPDPPLNKGARYFWRVDMVLDDAVEIKGDVWAFYTEALYITEQTVYQIVEADTEAAFSVTATAPSAPSYQWYKYVEDDDDIELSDDGNISGSESDTLTISSVQSADEGYYYCVVSAEALSVQSNLAPLAIKRLLAYWDFESENIHSIVAGSPASILYGNPVFETGIDGQGLAFSTDEGGDLLYTDPDEVSYFDICNYQMTVALWIKSSFAATWGPMVARDGESGMGWQLRHHGGTLDRICFTTRGTDNDDGRPSNRTVYDGDWHYVVGTFDGSVKKVYIDGVISRLYSTDDGGIAAEAEAAGGVINATAAPVSLAGRVRGVAGNLDIQDWSVTPGVLDEVAIYNYVLDAATIAQTYADMSGAAVCPALQQYDLDGDCIVNLNDLALLASEWLSDISVQPTP